MEQQGAALPWGSAGQQQEEEAHAVHPDVPSSIGLQLGSRVEVLWEVSSEEEGGQEVHSTKWWGAELSQRVDGQTDGEGRAVYVLRYDPDPESGFHDHEETSVTFLEEHYLYDLARDDELPWRRAGEAWEAPAPADGTEAEERLQSYSLAEIEEDIRKSERRRGRTLDEDAAEMLSELPPEQRLFVAAGFQAFQEQLGAAIARLCEQRGPDYVVTEADVKAATVAAKAAMQRRSM